MKQEIKTQWVKALRGNLYPLGRKNLRTNTGYSAIGILIEILMRTGKFPSYKWRRIGRVFRFVETDKRMELGNLFIPSENFAKLHGIPIWQLVRLSDMSDSKEFNSKSIADWIEKEVQVTNHGNY